MYCWYVVSVQPGKSKLAETQLKNQHFGVFNPLHKVSFCKGSRFANKLESLFPGYLFVGLNEDAGQWRAVNGTYGVKKLVCLGEKPTPISSEFIKALQLLVDSEGVVNHAAILKNGQPVELLTGPFAGKIGKILEIGGHGRVVVMLHMLSHIPVHTEASNLLPVG